MSHPGGYKGKEAYSTACKWAGSILTTKISSHDPIQSLHRAENNNMTTVASGEWEEALMGGWGHSPLMV